MILVHKIHVSMVANVIPMELQVSHVSVFSHLQDNDVKIVSLITHLNSSTSFYAGINPCASQPCRNGGTCQSVNGNSYQCICPGGYSGFDCSTRKWLFMLDDYIIVMTWYLSGIDLCASQPCRNGGTCRPINTYAYQCICPAGYSGFDCSTRKLFIFW